MKSITIAVTLALLREGAIFKPHLTLQIFNSPSIYHLPK